jgi:hypothetical protein
MPRETIRRASCGGRPERPTHLAPGPPRETSAHATPCRKTPYALRKTRTPRPGGQGVHSEPFGAPVSRAPLEVGRAGRVLNVLRDLARRRELDSPPWRAQHRVLDLSRELDRRVTVPRSSRSKCPLGRAASRFPDRVDEARHRRWQRGSRCDEHGGAATEGLRSNWQVSTRRGS